MAGLRELRTAFGYEFRDDLRVQEVLTHSTLLNEPPGQGRRDNTRLAHLGDAVIGLAVRSALFRRFPDADKGTLTKAASNLVSDPALATLAKRLKIGKLLMGGLSLDESRDKDTVLAELFEAAIGAVFVESDYGTAAEVVMIQVVLPERL